jgi:hypothetical protein
MIYRMLDIEREFICNAILLILKSVTVMATVQAPLP